ncbi:hypothetical protein [Pseudomonas chlororaphis]|uniref:hypothetical protein n=1 Tax=Pseudomonas chlororaphis TaxID=587753 RepID=UPI000F58C148|nr:hypothetical protein [Pseudomonas chlororaphis]WDG71553.1 hypothetical protein PUP65_26175 [Pseudomonas chlororaphis]WDH30663.1 hypothetical protein PUP81_08145 [Pseudomonas chlororaphis]WDH70078.1 hypothetical protein PUP78_26160 [Pseudomonas chlororaphis]
MNIKLTMTAILLAPSLCMADYPYKCFSPNIEALTRVPNNYEVGWLSFDDAQQYGCAFTVVVNIDNKDQDKKIYVPISSAAGLDICRTVSDLATNRKAADFSICSVKERTETDADNHYERLRVIYIRPEIKPK